MERTTVARWNRTARDHATKPWVHEAFRGRARTHPQDIALRSDGRSTSYGELDRQVDRLVRLLRERGAGPGAVVGLAVDRSPELVVAVLATLAAGAAYLPLDPQYPAERTRFVIEDARPAVLLTQTQLRDGLPSVAVPVLELDRLPQPPGDAPAGAAVGPGSAAYVIYTSGSTGRPKGVVVTHAALRNRIAWMQETFGLTAHDRVLQKTPSSFDVSVWEFFWPLTAGAVLVLARPGGHLDLAYLVELVQAEGVSTLHFVPSLLRLFLAEPGVSGCRTLRRTFCSGEALPPDLARQHLTRLPGELYNLYGPTETTVDVTWWRCRPGDDTVPIGRPVDNTSVRVLDGLGHEVPIGEIGEICVGGVQVARGYLDRPALTAERFLPDAWSEEPGARLYRTGDLGRFRPDGAVEFLGRRDSQVKIHGNRVELGEIESHLAGHHDVAGAAVTLGDRAGTPVLVAHVVAASGATVDVAALTGYLRRRLPPVMVPARLRLLDRLPLTPSGKLDRAALAATASEYPGPQPGSRVGQPVDPDATAAVGLRPAAERQLVDRANAAERVGPRHSVPGRPRLAGQALRRPDAVAVRSAGRDLTFRELAERQPAADDPPWLVRLDEALDAALGPVLDAVARKLVWQDADEVLLAIEPAEPDAADAATLGPLLALTTGGRLDVATEADVRAPGSLTDLVTADITTVSAAMRTWRALVDGGWDGDPGLRLLCVAGDGDVLDADLLLRLAPLGRAVWCACSPPGTAAWTLTARLGDAEANSAFSPVAGSAAHVLDPFGREAPAGVPGELVLGTCTGSLVRTGRVAARRPDGLFDLAPGRGRP